MSSEAIRTSHAILAGVTPRSRPWLAGRLGRAVDRLLVWHERASQRRLLSALDHQMLHDIGLSRADAEGEAGKPFWRP